MVAYETQLALFHRNTQLNILLRTLQMLRLFRCTRQAFFAELPRKGPGERETTVSATTSRL